MMSRKAMIAKKSCPNSFNNSNEEILTSISLLIRTVYTLPCTVMFSNLKDVLYYELHTMNYIACFILKSHG